jgi:hypothetical protein
VVARDDADAGLVKVLYRGASETAWARPLGEGVFELDNSPFFVEYSWLDRVRCEQGADGQLEVVELVRASGHVTLRALLDPLVDASTKDALLKRITELGGSYEGAEGFYYAIDVPPGVDRRPIEELLRAHEDDVMWEEGMSESFRDAALAAVGGVGRTAEHAAPLGDEEAEESLLVDIEAVETTTRHYERLFATAIGDEVRVLNAPFFAYGLAYGDRVDVERRAGRTPLLREVTHPSGHYTARAILEDDRFEPELRAAVREVGGRFERLAGTQMIAIDIPGADEAKRLRTRLDAMEAEGKLGYETGW